MDWNRSRTFAYLLEKSSQHCCKNDCTPISEGPGLPPHSWPEQASPLERSRAWYTPIVAKRKVDEWLWQVGTDLQRLTDEMGQRRPSLASGRYWEPRVDVVDLGDRILVRAEIAGVRVEEVGLLYNLDRHSLTIRGHRREELEEESQCAFHQLEVPFGEFQREVRLPNVAIDPEGIRAHYRNGFLYVVLPKRDRIFVASVTISEI